MNPNDFERFLFGLRPHRNDKQSCCVNFYDAKLEEIYQKYCHFDDAKRGEIYYNQYFKISRSDKSELEMTVTLTYWTTPCDNPFLTTMELLLLNYKKKP